MAAQAAARSSQALAALEAEHGGRLGVWAWFADRPAFGWRADERFAFCSSFKLSLAAMPEGFAASFACAGSAYGDDPWLAGAPDAGRTGRSGAETVGQWRDQPAAAPFWRAAEGYRLLAVAGGSGQPSGRLRDIAQPRAARNRSQHDQSARDGGQCRGPDEQAGRDARAVASDAQTLDA
ncbi:hypothetical protein E4T56_gene20708 [Termitomyces sp. T112]|nr:hypothetical protein E4T56_gene20708 [Termitomyces sp. T112]